MVTTPVELAQRRLGELLAARRQMAGASGREVVIGLFGRGIQASRTPFMHEREGERLGLSYIYLLVDFDALGLSDSDLTAMLEAVEGLGFAGINVTHPFKQAILPLLDRLSPDAAAIGAVNTVVLHGETRIGHNTDGWGFAESLREGLSGAPLGAVAQFGAGGAGAAVAHALLSLGVERLVLCETRLPQAAQLADRLGQHFPAPVLATSDPQIALSDAMGLVNTTPVGMDKYPGLPFPEALLQRQHWVAEIVYFPPDTALLQRARALGCRTLAGTGMAVYQAVKAFELFTGIAPDRKSMTEHFRAAA